MIGVEEALAEIIGVVRPRNPWRIEILDDRCRVLTEEDGSDIDMPPFDNSAMGCYAVRAADVAGASPESPVRLAVTGSVAAGYVSSGRVEPGTAIRIMTGAPLPDGAVDVLPLEDTGALARPKEPRRVAPASQIELRPTVHSRANTLPTAQEITRT